MALTALTADAMATVAVAIVADLVAAVADSEDQEGFRTWKNENSEVKKFFNYKNFLTSEFCIFNP